MFDNSDNMHISGLTKMEIEHYKTQCANCKYTQQHKLRTAYSTNDCRGK